MPLLVTGSRFAPDSSLVPGSFLTPHWFPVRSWLLTGSRSPQVFETPLAAAGLLPGHVSVAIFSNLRQIMRINSELHAALRAAQGEPRASGESRVTGFTAHLRLKRPTHRSGTSFEQKTSTKQKILVLDWTIPPSVACAWKPTRFFGGFLGVRAACCL